MHRPIRVLALVSMVLCQPVAAQVEWKDDAVQRVAQSHDPALFVATGALYLKQEALRAANGVSLPPDVETQVDRLIERDVRDVAWFHAGWTRAIDRHMTAEEADEVAAHFTTEGGKLQRRVIELAIAEVVVSTYTFTDRIDYRVMGSRKELIDLQRVMDERLFKGVQDFSAYPNAVKFASSGAGVKYMKMLMIQGVEAITLHFADVAKQIRASVADGLAADRPN